jgi:hypothetical protein
MRGRFTKQLEKQQRKRPMQAPHIISKNFFNHESNGPFWRGQAQRECHRVKSIALAMH